MKYIFFFVVSVALLAILIYTVKLYLKTALKNGGKDNRPPDDIYPMW